MNNTPEAPAAPRKRAPGGGRKHAVPGEKLVPLNVSVTPAQREKFRKHLGAAWMRKEIDAAVVGLPGGAAAGGTGE